MEKGVTKDWVELTPLMLAPCSGCGALWNLEQSCPICNDVDLTEVNEEAVCQQELKVT
jgi:hypothetical protein